MSQYCTKADALNWVTSGSVTNPRRRIAEVQVDTDTFVLEDHRLETGDDAQLWLRNGEMAAPLVEGHVYKAIRVSDSTFKVATNDKEAENGNAIPITSAGSNMVLVIQIPWTDIIERVSGLIDDMLMANAMPIAEGQAIPPVVNRYASVLTISEAALFVGKEDEGIEKHVDRVYEAFKLYLAGKPIRVDAPPATNKAIRTPSASGRAADTRGWARTCNGEEVLP